MENKIYGIDLGTTYSAIAFVNDATKAEIIPNSDNERVTPSVVFFESASKVIVGKEARETAKTDPDKVVALIKREMGTDMTKEFDGKSFTPEEISSFILKRLVDDAKTTGDHDVKDVVITCPAYFGAAERNATENAGKLAGLNVIQILDEPIAAAISYVMDRLEQDNTVIVYDLGGGTFDATVVKVGKGNVEVVCTDGDHQLGGADWDQRLINYFISEFQSQTGGGEDIVDDAETMFDLRLLAENAKKHLTKKESTVVRVTYGGEKVNIEVTRDKFNELTQDLLQRTIEFTNNVLEIAKGKGITKIDDFLLVGGSTRMCQVPEAVKSNFSERLGVEPKSFEVDEAVAKGAALFGFIKYVQQKINDAIKEINETNQGSDDSQEPDNRTEEQKEQDKQEAINKVLDEIGLAPEKKEIVNVDIKTVATRSYGLRVLQKGNPVVFNMIMKQTQVPASFEREFPVTESNAEKLVLTVFSNNDSEKIVQLDDSVEVGNATMMLTEGLPAGSPIRVKFCLDKDGSLKMEALDVTNNKSIDANFDVKDGLSQEEIEKKRAENADISVE